MTVTINPRTLGAIAAGVAVLFVAVFLFQPWQVGAAPGDTDATFVPIAPCRLIDTRPGDARIGPHGGFGIEDTKTILARGSNGDCVIPADAVALSLNVTALAATATSFLTLWPDGDRPNASSLNPVPGQPPTPNAATTNLSDAGSFNVFNSAGTVNVIIDISGYYVKTSLLELGERLDAAETRLAAIEAAQPFAVTNRDDSQILTNAREVIVSVTITAPTAGQVVVNSSTESFVTAADTGAECFITQGTDADNDYAQRWRASLDNGLGQMGGTRMFDIAAGATETYDLTCRQFGTFPNGSGIENSVLTAIFTPAAEPE